MNATVTLTGAVFPSAGSDCAPETGVCRPAMPHPFNVFGVVLTSDANGLVSYTPAMQSAWGAVRIAMAATAGTSASQSLDLQVFTPVP